MIVRVVALPGEEGTVYGKPWIYNGYAQKRVAVGELTELPDELDKWDDNGKFVGRKKLSLPKWAEFVRDSDDGPLVMKSGRAPKDEGPKPETLAAQKPKQIKVGGVRGGVGKRPSDVAIG